MRARNDVARRVSFVFFFQAEDGIRDLTVTGVQTCALPIFISGERRYRAAGLAGLDEIPAIELDANDQETLEIALVENIQRKDLTPFEEAEGDRKSVV